MAETKYTIDISAPPAKLVRDLGVVDGAIGKTDTRAEKLKATLKSIGAAGANLKAVRVEVDGIGAACRSATTSANATANATKKIGAANAEITALSAKLKGVKAELDEVTAAAIAAQAAMAGIGSGGGGKGSGGKGSGKGGMVSGFGKAMAINAGVRIASRAVGVVGEAGTEARSYFTEAAEEASSLRESLRENTNLVGGKEVDDAQVRSHLKFMKDTGLDSDEAKAFRLEYGGAIALGKARGNIDDKTSTELEKETAKFGLRYDLDMTTAGRMAGLMANYQKIPSAAAGVGTMAESAEQMNIYGVGPVKGMIGPMMATASSMLDEEGGRFRDFPSLAARFAATTSKTGGNASTAANQLRQTNRALRKLVGKNDLSTALGVDIKADDTFEQALAKVAPKIAGPDADLVLSNAGFENEREREGLIKQAELIPSVEKQLADPRMKAANTDAVANNDRFDSSQLGIARRAANQAYESQVETGMLGEKLKSARMAATGRLADPRQPGGQQLKAGALYSLVDSFYSTAAYGRGRSESGEDLRIDSEAVKGLVEGGRKVGVDVEKAFPDLVGSTSAGKVVPLDPDYYRQEFGKAYDAVTSKGGDPLGGDPKNAAKALRNAADALDAMGKGGQGGQDERRPPPGGGAGFVPGRR